MNRSKLRGQLNTHFTISELRDLCYDLDIDHENVPGQTKQEIARELVTYCENRGWLGKLITQCKKLRPGVHWGATEPSNIFPLRHLLHARNPLFTGRVEWLEELDKSANGGTATVITQAITGMGGIGKTQLAIEYCYRRRDKYDLIWQLRADNTTTLGSDMAELAYKLELAHREADLQATLAALLRWLEMTECRWLLLYDNADAITRPQLRPYLPKEGNGIVFITSRNPTWGQLARTLVLDLFTKQEAVDFLFADRPDALSDGLIKQAAVLAATLDYFPLALEHARAYVEATSCTLADYRDYFQTERRELWVEADPPDEYHATIAATWEMSFKAAREQDAAAVPLLNLCCFLAPDNIPLSILRENGETLPKGLRETAESKRKLDKAIAALRRYSLIERDG
ncbi:MAG: hypothetical protein GY803_19150, partial [Chloroflexi bacterium]|nr:hypothetical protein [Chloroflexota bacterium]